MLAVEIEGLVKDYPRSRAAPTRALDGLDLTVPEGGVFGFLGPNGSGKTTTIRCMLGLARPTSGRCRVLGADPATGIAQVIRRIGSLVEGPGLFASFSGREDLGLLGRLHGIGPKTVDEVLDRVGLAERGDDLVKTYSLGMLQRLGIGAALLKDPALLVLDEPANGLDPAGIKEVRDLLRVLGDEGRTVFVSSHNLPEVELICDRVAILSRGRCVASGAVGELLTHRSAAGLLLRVDDLQRGLSILRSAGFDPRLEGGFIHVDVPSSEGATIARLLARDDLYVTELRPVEIGLEALFLDLTQSGAAEGVS